MTRRPGKARRAHKPLRKTAKPGIPAKRHSLDDLVAAAARSLDIKIEDAWLPQVRAQLEVILHHGTRVAEFALPDETDPAPVFEA